MTYQQIFEWIYQNYDLNNYFSAEELLYDVKNEFNRTHAYFPIEAEDLVKERFQFRREYAEMQAREEEQKRIAEFIGGGEIPTSISDEIVEDLQSHESEIMGIDMTEFATKRETVVPPEIVKYATRQSTLGRFAGLFRRLFRR
jgi:hypothetical protein